MKYPFSAAVLAGGKGRRLQGACKALIALDGKTLLERHIKLLTELFAPVFVVSDYLEHRDTHGVNVTPDLYKNMGPLAGLHAALTFSAQKDVFVVACDMPHITARAIDTFFARCDMTRDACVAYASRRRHPLFGLYKRTCLYTFDTCLMRGERRVQNALNLLETCDVDMTDFKEAFFNLNEPADLLKVALAKEQELGKC